MPKITKIEVQKKNKDRFNIYLDQQFEMGIDIDTLVKFNIRKDQVLEPSDLEKIQKYDHYRYGLNLAIQYLSFKKRTEKEVREHLLKYEINENAINEVIHYCYKECLIDHQDYAESLKNTMIRTTDKGPEIFKQKLYQLGIEEEIIVNYTQIYEDEQPLDDIVKLGEKILKNKKGPATKVKQKVTQSLIQKGYTLDVIKKAIEQLDFDQDEEIIDSLLQKDLEKVYNKNQRKYDHQKTISKTIESLMRKGYKYDKIKLKLEESGLSNDE